MKSFFQHGEPPTAFVAGIDVGPSEDFTVVTLWECIDGRYTLLDYGQARPCQPIALSMPGGTQVLVEVSEVGIFQ